MTRSRASAEPRPSDCHLRVRRRTTHERPHRSPFSNTGIARRAVLSSRLDPTLIVLRAFRVHSGLSCCTRLSGLLRCEVIRYSTRYRCPGVTRCERRSRATIVEPVPSTTTGCRVRLRYLSPVRHSTVQLGCSHGRCMRPWFVATASRSALSLESAATTIGRTGFDDVRYVGIEYRAASNGRVSLTRARPGRSRRARPRHSPRLLFPCR